jgi:hypothetical protein
VKGMDRKTLDDIRNGEWERVTIQDYIDETDVGHFHVVIEVSRLKNIPEIVKILVKAGDVRQEILETEGVVIIHYPTLMVISSFSYYGMDGVFLMKRFVSPVWDKIVGKLG